MWSPTRGCHGVLLSSMALGEQWQQVQSAITGAERVFRVLALPAETASDEPLSRPMPVHTNGAVAGGFPDAAGCQRRGVAAGLASPIELRDVVFGYLPDRPILRGISFDVAAGEHVALVGRTGAGKTSALHLLAGLYVPWLIAAIDGRQTRTNFAAEWSVWDERHGIEKFKCSIKCRSSCMERR